MTITPRTATDPRIPHTRWCPARSRRGHPTRGFDKKCLRCMMEKHHDYGRHAHADGANWRFCQPCELTVTLAARSLAHLWPMREVPAGFRR